MTQPSVYLKDPEGVQFGVKHTEGIINVSISDQTTPTVIVPLSKVTATTALTNAVSLHERSIVVDSTTGFIDGAFITVASIDLNRFYIGRQVGAVVGNTVQLDTPMDCGYPAGTQVTVGNINMAVDGSVTTQVFSLRASDPGLPVVVDITRLMFVCSADTTVDFSKFGDIAGGLTNGIVLRRVDGACHNIFNAKTNEELSAVMFDFNVTQKTNPVQGQDGFSGRLTFAGANKLGVAVRIGQGEDLELLVQDDLLQLVSLRVVAEGHVVID